MYLLFLMHTDAEREKMKLNRIKIENYRGQNFDFVPGHLNIMLKGNGSGKTSLCDAIRYGITGMMPKDDVRNMSVSITYENGLETERTRGKVTTCKSGGRRTTETGVNSDILDTIGVQSLEDVKIAGSGEFLSNLKPEELLKWLFQYIPERLDFDMVMDYFPALTDEIESECALIFPLMPEKFEIQEIEKAYKYFYDERKALSASQRNLDGMIKNLNPTPPDRTLSEIEQDLTVLAICERENAEYAKKQEAYVSAKQKREKQEKEICILTEQLSHIPAPEKPLENELKVMESRRIDAENKRSDRNEKLAIVKNNIRLFKQTLDELNTQVCPISKNLICTTDKTRIKTEIEDAIKRNQSVQVDLEKKITLLDEVIRKTCEDREAYSKKKQVYDAYQQNLLKLTLLKDNLIIIPEEPVLSGSTEELNQRKYLLNKEKANLEDFSKKTALKKQLDGLNHKINVYTTILKALEDKGEVKNAIMKHYMSTFIDVCNERAEEFAPGYAFNLVPENGIRILVQTPSNGGFYPIESLSCGENLVAMLILMDMANQLSGSRILFLDNVEALDEDRLECLRDLIERTGFQDAYDHIFICGVNHSDVVKAFVGMNAAYL